MYMYNKVIINRKYPYKVHVDFRNIDLFTIHLLYMYMLMKLFVIF